MGGVNKIRAASARAISFILIGSAFLAFGQRISVPKKFLPILKPDLAITGLRLDKDCFVEIEITNAGILAVDSTLALRLNTGGRTVFDERISIRLASQEMLAVSTREQGIRLSGDARAEALLDAENMLAESDEANNRLEKVLSCPLLPQAPDIALADLRPDPESPQTLGLVSFKMLIVNAGPEHLPEMGLSVPWNWREKNGSWFPVGHSFGISCKGLAPGESAWLAAKDQGFIPDKPGEYEFEVGRIILGGVLSGKETNLADNRRSVTFSVSPNRLLPDLTVAELVVDPAVPSSESQVVIRAVIANRGAGPAPPFDIRIRVLQEGRSVHEYTSRLSGFGSGATHNFQTVADRLPAGYYSAEAVTDFKAGAEEESESNNSLSRGFEVVAQGGTTLRPPDIAVEDAAADPESPKAGDFVGFRVLLANRGPDPLAQTSVSITWQVRLQGEPWTYVGHSFGAALKALAPGESAWVKAEGQSFGTNKPGTYEIWISNVFLTGAMTERERELSNNKKIFSIQVRER